MKSASIYLLSGTMAIGASTSNSLSEKEIGLATQQAIQLQQQAQKLIKESLANNFFETHYPKKECLSQGMTGKSEQVKGCVSNITPSAPQRTSAQNEQGKKILVFVSLSMPEVSLKGLAQETQRVATQRLATQQHNAVLVMRGLYQDSFVKTAQKLQELGISVDINPELFETHHITSVPTFILVKNGHPVTTRVFPAQVPGTPAYCSLKGNVSLGFAVQKFEEQCAEDQQIKGAS